MRTYSNVKALAKACDGRGKTSYPLWADHTTHSFTIRYMLAKLMNGQARVMPTETAIATWAVLPWKEDMSRIRQLKERLEDITEAVRRQQEAQFRNKHLFDKKH